MTGGSPAQDGRLWFVDKDPLAGPVSSHFNTAIRRRPPFPSEFPRPYEPLIDARPTPPAHSEQQNSDYGDDDSSPAPVLR